MAKVHVKRNPDGSLSYLSDNLSWKPLVHGETRLTNSKGEPVLYDANRGGFVKEATTADYAKMGISQGYDALVRAGEQLGFYGEDTAQEWMKDTPVAMPDVMPSPEYRAASEKAGEGILPAVGQAVANPLDFTLPALAQSAPLMAVPLITTAAGLVAGGGNPLAGVAGAGIGSFAVNETTRYNDVLKELAQQHGVDPASDQFGVFANNPQVRQEVQQRALAYAAPVAAIDALSMGLAGRAAGAVKAIEKARGVSLAARSAEQAALAGRSIPGQVARGVATQIGLGAGSEVAGQVNETGGIYDPAGVAFEGILELPGGVAELSMSYLLGKSPAANPLEEKVDQEAARDTAPVTREDFVLAAQKIAPNNVEAAYNQLIQSGPVGISVAKKARTAANLSPGSAGMEFQPRQPRDLTRGQQKAIGEISKANAAQAAKNESYNPKNPVGATFAPSRGVIASGGSVTQEGMAPPLVGRWASERATSLGLPADIATQVGQKAAVSSTAEFNKKIVEYLDKVKRDPGFRRLSKDAKEAKLKEAYDLFQAKYTYENKDLGISKPVLPSIQRKAKEQPAAPVDLELQEIVERNQINNQAAANPPGERHLGGDYMLNAIPEGTEEFEQARLNLINSPSYQALAPAEKAAAEKELYLGGKQFNEQVAQANLSPSMTSTKPRDAAARANVSNVIEQLTASTRKGPSIFGNALKKSAVLDFPTKNNVGLQMYNQDLAANKGLADILAPNRFRDKAVKQREEAAKRTMAGLLKNETDTILKGTLQRMGLLGHVDPVVTLEKLANGAGGYVEGKTLVISALQPEGRSLIATINHESIHALRNLGLISVPEWKMLERAAAKGNWVSLYGFDTNPEYKNLGKEGLLEEAIAEHFSQTQRFKNDFQNENPHLVEKIRNRIAKFLGYLRTYINNILGVSTPEEVFDLFDRIESGELVAGRTPANKAFQTLDQVKFAHVRNLMNTVDATHISPHDFSEFNTDFMGTGEGNQAFGWGLYFGSAQEVAKNYFRQFKPLVKPEEATYKSIPYSELRLQDGEHFALARRVLREMSKRGSTFEEAKRVVVDQETAIQKTVPNWPSLNKKIAEIVARIDSLDKRDFSVPSTKKSLPLSYWVKFWNDPINKGHLANYHLPINQQSAYVQKGIAKLLAKYPFLSPQEKTINWFPTNLGNPGEIAYYAFVRTLELKIKGLKSWGNSDNLGDSAFKKLLERPNTETENARAASLLLAQVAEIPGLQYRAMGGTNESEPNYVIYDGSFVEIQDKGTFNWEKPIKKMSAGLKDKVKKEKDSLVSALPGKRPENFKEDLRSATSRIGLIGWWFRDLQTHASRIPSLRPLFHISKQMEQKAHAIRSYATAKLVPILKWSKEDRALFSKAAAYLAINEEPLPKFTKPDGTYPDTFDIKLDSDFAGLGVKAGDTVTITPKLMRHLEVIDRLFSGLRKEHYLSTTWDVFGDALEKAGFTNLNMRNIVSDTIRIRAKQGRVANTITVEELGQLEAAASALEQIEKMSKHFHLPRVRQSPYFVTIYDKSKPIATPTIGSRIKTTVAEDEPYERIGTINLPTNMFGKLQSKASLLEYMNKRLEEFKAVHPGAFMPVDKPNFGVVDLTGIKSAAAARNFITAGQFDIFEQMALANEIPGLSNEERLALLQSMREAWAKRGFALHEKKALGLQGYLHNDNLDNYVVGAGSVYASRAATTIAKNQYASSMNGARAELAHKAMTGVIHQSVREYADDYVNYVFSNQNEFAQLRSWMFNYFLGLNPSSAALNLLQVVHSSLPILTNMYGSPGEAAKALAKYTNQSLLSKDSFIRWSDPSNPNPYKDIIDKATDDLESLSEHERLIYDLIEKGTLRPHTVEEMQARDVSLQLSGEKKDIEGFTDFANKAGNIFSFMFNRVEATTRVATALAAYDLAKKAKSSPAIKARLEKMLESTPWAGSDVNDASLMAEIAIELSHPDTTKFNRAKAFRGALAVPTQFLAFPVKMLDQYIGLFKQAFGVTVTDGKMDWSNTTPEARKAFLILFLGLMMTSGLSGAVPFGEPAKDAYDKLYKLITGIDPDIETEMREALTDLTGSSVVAEMVDKGAVRALAGIDISQRVGVQTFSGVATSGDIWDLLGPAGSTVGTIQDAYNYWVSGHETLAMATLAPAAIRNPLKALYANEYGVVSRQGNVLPTTYNYLDTAFQAVGFTPTKVSRAREEQFASNRLVSRTAVAKERAYDSLVALRVKSILARQRGNAEEEQEFLQEYRDYLKDLQASNQSADVKNRVKIDMPTVTRRVMEQLRSINQGKLQQRRASPAIRREQANLAQVYPEH